MGFSDRIDGREGRDGFNLKPVDSTIRGGDFLLPETQALVRAMSVAPSGARVITINNTIQALIANGIWPRLDFLYLHAAHDAQAGLLNWIAPTTLLLTNNNSTTFTTDRGYTGDGVSMSLSNTNYTPSKWTQDSGSAGVVALTNGNSANSLTVRNGSAALRAQVRARNTTSAIGGISAAIGTTALTGAATPNMVAVDRSDAGNQSVFVNGGLDVTGAQASLSFGGTPGEIRFLSNGTTFSTQQIAMAWGGAALGASGHLAMYTIFKNLYFASLGITI